MNRFEETYAAAGADLASIGWVRLRPNPVFAEWLESRRFPAGRALVVGCGVGDDAAHLAERGFDVTAFDVAPTAIDRARERFGELAVDFVVADWLDQPEHWRGAFDLVVEIGNVQAVAQSRPEALAAIAGAVAPGGTLFVRCYATADDAAEPGGDDGPPWPLTRRELRAVETSGLELRRFDDGQPGGGGSLWWTAEYVRPAASAVGGDA